MPPFERRGEHNSPLEQTHAHVPSPPARFCVGDRFFLVDNKILCEYDYEERMVFANLAYNSNNLAHIKQQARTAVNAAGGGQNGGGPPPVGPPPQLANKVKLWSISSGPSLSDLAHLSLRL